MSAFTRDDIVAAARAWLGTPYWHQASLKGVGCDCLGLVRGVWREIVGAEPEPMRPYSPDWAEAGAGETLIELGERYFHRVASRQWREGDVLLFRFHEGVAAKHLAIATGEGRMIHAHDGACVAEVAIGGWRHRIAGVFSFPGLADAE
jgi:NlpC/P60 family putative phage cell wall peptidase